ncbi:MAG: GGDEF domain-containing protein [Bacteroidia bacterium]|jgi:diguanylate cyclase (GGDEF)-like protein|nr:GGDEF domain-containing protein [Bacteroidia bacterium]
MVNYIRESVKKFKNDALSKGIYDLLKWLIISLILLIPTKWIPYVKKWFLTQHYITTYAIIISAIVLITITTFFVSRYFRKKIRLVLNDNHTDELTGLKNHKALNEYLKLKLQQSKNRSESLSLIIIDIDDFKSFNTLYGFKKADQILKNLGELLSNDKRVTDETFRYFNRGDEFLVVAYDTTLSQAMQAAERKRKLIQKNLFSIDGEIHKLTVCCGVTELKKNDDYTSFTDRVTEALNEAKKISGKNNTKSIV